jgi:hypothetical protein
MATKFVILDAVRQRRGSRDYIMNKPYARLVARLAPISKAEALRVPPFNPFKLYANTTPLDAAERLEDGQQDASVKIVELLGGIVPSEDGQELSAEEVAEVVARAQAAPEEPSALRRALPRTQGPFRRRALADRPRGGRRAAPPGTVILAKSVFERKIPSTTCRAAKCVQGPARRHPDAHPAARRRPRPGRPGR